MTSFSTQTLVPVSEPQALCDQFVGHIEQDHDVRFETAPDGARFVEHAGFRVDFGAEAAGLRIRLSGPSSGLMIFFKDEIAKHIAEINPALAETLRWSGETAVTGELPENFRVLKVLRKSEPVSGLLRLTFAVPDADLFFDPGIHLRMMLPARLGRAPVWPRMAANGAPVWPQGEDALHARFLTIRHARKELGEIDLDIVGHGDGLLSSWASQTKPGAEIGAMGPTGTTEMPGDQTCFLAADLTGLSSVARMLEAAGPETQGHVIGEADSLDALRSYLPETQFTLSCLRAPVFSDRIVELTRYVAKPGQVGYAFFAGEFADAQSMRSVFKKELGLGKGAQMSVAYWRRGQAGFEA